MGTPQLCLPSLTPHHRLKGSDMDTRFREIPQCDYGMSSKQCTNLATHAVHVHHGNGENTPRRFCRTHTEEAFENVMTGFLYGLTVLPIRKG